MTDTTVSRLGQLNAAGDADALFLKLFGGEVLTEFERATVFKGRHFVRPIANGKSAQFPMIGGATAAYHTPGTFIDGQKIAHNEKVITIDDLLVAATFLSNIDEAKNHYEVRQPYAQELGRVLAQTYDKNVAQCMVLAARAASQITGRAGGSQISNANMATDGAVMEAAIYTAAQTFDEKYVPEGQRTLFVRPLQFYLLAQRDRLINKELGGTGSIAEGAVKTVANIDIVKTMNVPSTLVNAGPAKYQGDFTKTVGIVSTPMAAGTVQLLDLAMESEYEIRRQGTFMVAKYAVGHDFLRADCAIELKVT